jgi:YD repeat-containing protein
MEFGMSASSRILPANESTPLIWALSKVTDTKGNYYEVTYQNDAANSQFYPTRIDYTGNASTSPALTPYNSVQFVYDLTRSDVETGYVVNSPYRNTARLTSLKTYSGSTLVRDYRLAYVSSVQTGRSRLVSIQECEGAGTCLLATTFTWKDHANDFSGGAMFLSFTSDQIAGLEPNWVDINGDGRADFCRRHGIGELVEPGEGLPPQYLQWEIRCTLSTPNGWGAEVKSPAGYDVKGSTVWLDINGDGMADFCSIDGCFIANGAGFSVPFSHSPGTSSREGVDLNGDGRTDMCTVPTNLLTTPISGTAACAISNGSGFGAAFNVGTYSDWVKAGGTWTQFSSEAAPSLCRVLADNSLGCRTYRNGSLGTEVRSPVLDAGKEHSRAWVDVNGDGKSDFCRANVSAILCTLSTGSGFGTTISASASFTDPTPGKRSVFWGDMNGDGRADVCGIRTSSYNTSDAQVICHYSLGNSFSAAVSSGNTGTYLNANWQVQDVTGDGKADYCYVTSIIGSGSVTCIRGTSGMADHLATITDGLGASATLDYKPISDASVYGKGTGASYPMVELQDATHVVSRVVSSDGLGGSNTVSYNYATARADLHGRGFLGFGLITTYLPDGTYSQTSYNQVYPYTGTVANSVRKRTSTGATLTESTSSYSATALGGTRYFVYPTGGVSKTWDLNGASLSWTATSLANYDSYGNPQLSQTSSYDSTGAADGYSTLTSTTYSNDTANWILGLPTAVTVTATKPGGVSASRSANKSYWPSGQLKQEIVEPNNGGLASVTNLRLQTDYTYDGYGNLLTKAVSGANITARTEATYTYDSRGQFALTYKNALNHTETRAYDARFGAMSSLTGPNGLTTSWLYDGFGRVTRETRADGTVTNTAYTAPWGLPAPAAQREVMRVTVQATGAPQVLKDFDRLGRPVRNYVQKFDAVTPDSGYYGSGVNYDNLGRAFETVLPYDTTAPQYRYSRTAYDELGRPVSVTAPDNSVTQYAYNGRTTSVTNANGQVTQKVRNSQGQVVSVTNAHGTADASAMAYEYDVWGNLTKTIDALGNATTLTYDLRGRKVTMNDPNLGVWSYTYDNLGQLLTQKDAKNQTTGFSYDLLGRMIARTNPSLNSNWYYDKTAANTACGASIGKLCEATAANGYRRLHSYDSLGRASSSSTYIDSASVPYVVDWTYDASGRLSTVTYPNTGTTSAPRRLKVQYGYRATGYLDKVSNVTNSTANPPVIWQRNAVNADGNTIGESFGNGVSTTYSYDSVLGRLQNIQSAHGSTGLLNLSYVYDSLANVTTRNDNITGVNETFGYDHLDRLKTASLLPPGQSSSYVTSVAYNAIGSIVSKSTVGPPPLTVRASPTTVVASRSDPGALSAAASATVTGGETPYSYAWARTGGTSAVINVLNGSTPTPSFNANLGWGANANETFQVTVTDVRGRTGVSTVTANFSVAAAPPAPSISASPSSPSASRADPGIVSVSSAATASGGLAPLSYQWVRTGGSTNVISVAGATASTATFSANLSWGGSASETFQVTVIDALSRTASAAVTVNLSVSAAPAAPTVSISPSTYSKTSRGSFTHSITVSPAVSGGVEPLSYAWTIVQPSSLQHPAISNPAILNPVISGQVASCELGHTDFRLIVTDALGRTATATARLSLVSNAQANGSGCILF